MRERDFFAPAGGFQRGVEFFTARIEHVNGALKRQADASCLGGAIFVDLNQAVNDHPELVQRHLLTEAVKPSDDIFAALHAALRRVLTALRS